jgi:hypothetical protein
VLDVELLFVVRDDWVAAPELPWVRDPPPLGLPPRGICRVPLFAAPICELAPPVVVAALELPLVEVPRATALV